MAGQVGAYQSKEPMKGVLVHQFHRAVSDYGRRRSEEDKMRINKLLQAQRTSTLDIHVVSYR